MSKSKTFYFLDFDGVLCDSARECFTVSRMAYALWRQQPLPTIAEAKSNEDQPMYESFLRLRPLIKVGEDMVLLHHYLRNRQPITATELSKAEHDIAHLEPKVRKTLRHLFYQQRYRLLNQNPDLWHNLSPLYPGVVEKLKQWQRQQNVFILSNKKSEYIKAILIRNQINWPENRLIWANGRSKLTIIASMIPNRQLAYYVDDQIALLVEQRYPLIIPYLASWGYVRESWKEDRRITALDLNDFLTNFIHK